ncbi:MAG: M36 family metallopeptidase, partial [Proteobacteria bacterium]|nr:M36 family metallopeptidase [Pseudomonadota bacterium]
LSYTLDLDGTPLRTDAVLVAVGNDRPTLLRAGLTPLVAPAATAVDAARQLVTRLAPAWNVTAMPVLESRGDVILAGPGSREPATHIVRFAQVIDGMPIDRGELRVMVRASGELVLIAGALFDVTQAVRVRADVATAAAAIDRAIAHAYGSPRGVEVTRARAERAWHVDGDHLVAAWVVEAFAGTGGTDGDAWRTVVGADGRILAHASLVASDATDYRVYADATARPLDGPIADFTPHPSGVPDHSFPAYVASRVVHVDGLNHPVGGAPDPWLASGATTSSGNNVDAYPDLVPPDGLAGDTRASTSGPNAFDYTYDLAQGPLASTTQQSAAVVSLFYAINYLHDFWYDAGFVEAAGNAQASNLGRAGGMEGDPLLAEAQDSANAGTRNNANMATPGDGMSPRMQVYLWSGHDDIALTVAGRTPAASGASFEPADYDVTGTVRAAEDAVGTLTDGCEPFATVLTGTIALVDRGGCTFKSKVLRAQQAGAIGVLVANNTGTSPPSLGGDSTITDPITIPVMGVATAEGAAIRVDLN